MSDVEISILPVCFSLISVPVILLISVIFTSRKSQSASFSEQFRQDPIKIILFIVANLSFYIVIFTVCLGMVLLSEFATNPQRPPMSEADKLIFYVLFICFLSILMVTLLPISAYFTYQKAQRINQQGLPPSLAEQFRQNPIKVIFLISIRLFLYVFIISVCCWAIMLVDSAIKP